MLQLNFIKNNRQLVLEGLAVKQFKDVALIDKVILLDDERKSLQHESEELSGKVNATSRQIGEMIQKGNKAEGEKMKAEVAELKSSLHPLAQKLELVEREMSETLLLIPNLPHKSVPHGKTPAENEIVKEGGDKPTLPEDAAPHWELAKTYHLIDFDLGNKVTGSGFPFYKNKGAKLQRSLIQYFLDYNVEAGYTEYQPPLLVNEQSAFGTGQLPDKEGQMYFVTEDQLFLIPTAEVPLTNIFRNEIVKEEDLPLKLTAYTPCFRREAGSYGKDVRGLNRVHQFDKVEIVQLVHPSKSYEALENMVLHVEKLLVQLELPYRILRLCGGDMGFASALTYDFEVYSAAQQKWLEVSSVSNFETFQSNRMKVRFKDAEGKSHLVHTLNGSSLALPRIVAALLENNQMENGIRVPAKLQSYFGAAVID